MSVHFFCVACLFIKRHATQVSRCRRAYPCQNLQQLQSCFCKLYYHPESKRLENACVQWRMLLLTHTITHAEEQEGPQWGVDSAGEVDQQHRRMNIRGAG